MGKELDAGRKHYQDSLTQSSLKVRGAIVEPSVGLCIALPELTV
jgi:hypothetical protein